MEFEEKFLNEDYLATRLRDFKEIRQKKVTFFFEHSDRYYSNSIYVCFCVDNKKFSTLRISDHIVKSPHTTFIVTQGKVLTKKKREQFVKLVEKTIKKANFKSLERKLKVVGVDVDDLLI